MGTRRGGIVSDDRLRELYATALTGQPAGAAGEHPAPEVLAALVRREGSEEARLATLDHVMRCAECRRELDLLRTVERAGVESGAAGRAGGRRGWLMPAALAASVLLAVGVGRTVLRSGVDDTTRGDGHGAVELVQPGREATAGDVLTFSWRAVPGASRYELELLDAGGGVLASAATTDTTASPAAARALPPGDYRWWVRATTSDARSLRSAPRPLRLVAR
jgi:hypothetical protein